MSTLNNSVIICNVSPKSTKKKTPLGIKKSRKNVKRTFYERPLKYIQLSNKKREQTQTLKKLIRKTKQITRNKKNVISSAKEKSLQDTIIILSDNESESNNKADENNCKKKKKTKKRSLSILINDKQNTQNNSNEILNQTKTEIERPPRKRKKKNIVALSENNSSCLLISDTEDSEITTVDLDDENRVPVSDYVTQGSDDIVVVWSSTGTPPSIDQEKVRTIDQEKNDRIFMIDSTPDPKNLSCLEYDEEIISQQNKKNVQENDAQNEEKKENEIENPNYLPFSKSGLKLPKPHNISKNIIMNKPKTPQRLRNLRRRILNYSISNTSTTSTTSTTFTKCATSTTTSTTLTKYTKFTPTTFNKYTTSTTSTRCTVPILYNPQTAFAFKTNNIGSRFELYRPELSTVGSSTQPCNKLREIVIDGNNIAMAHKNGKTFSEEGIMIVANYFRQRGHIVKVFVPLYRRSTNHPLLEKMYADGIVIFTPSRFIGGKRITPYDDRFILEYATMCGGIVVSLDQYRDLYNEKPEWRETIEKRLLTPTFVGNYVMFPEDPLGRNGPKLQEFLRY